MIRCESAGEVKELRKNPVLDRIRIRQTNWSDRFANLLRSAAQVLFGSKKHQVPYYSNDVLKRFINVLWRILGTSFNIRDLQKTYEQHTYGGKYSVTIPVRKKQHQRETDLFHKWYEHEIRLNIRKDKKLGSQFVVVRLWLLFQDFDGKFAYSCKISFYLLMQ